MSEIKRILIGTLFWLVVAAAPAFAKMPPYEVTVEVDGAEAAVTVVFIDYDMGVAQLEDVVGLYPADVISEGRPLTPDEFSPIPLIRTAPFTYEGSVEVPAAGDWAIGTFLSDAGDRAALAGMYPTFAFSVPGVANDAGESAVEAGMEASPSSGAGAEAAPAAEAVTPAGSGAAGTVPRSSGSREGSSSTPWVVFAGVGAAMLAVGFSLRQRRYTPVR